MTRSFVSLLAVALLVVVGCEKASHPGGPGATTPDRKPIVGQAEDTFSLDVPNLGTSLKQGESKTVTLSMKRGKNFDQDVNLKFSDLPKGLTIEPANAEVKAGDKDAKITLKAAEDAAIGDFVIKVTGHPTRGADASNEFKVSVSKK